jgi:aminoglycoside phosphotransferase (APT) family kinase protein
LAHVPGEVVGLAPLQGGSVNRTFRVDTRSGAFVLRSSPTTDAWLVSDRSVERRLHALAAGAGLAPKIVHADAKDRWLITEFVAGPVWTDAEFGNPDSLARLGATLRWLHGIPAPSFGRFDLLEVLGGYAQRLEPARVSGEVPPANYVQEAAFAWSLSGGTTRPPAVLHHDLHGSNLIDADQGLMLIDWECGVVNDPLLDVACVLSYFSAARPHAEILLKSAGLGSVTERQLAASVWLFDLHTWFWYRERKLRIAPTAGEIAAEQQLAAAVARGVPGTF